MTIITVLWSIVVLGILISAFVWPSFSIEGDRSFPAIPLTICWVGGLLYTIGFQVHIEKYGTYHIEVLLPYAIGILLTFGPLASQIPIGKLLQLLGRLTP